MPDSNLVCCRNSKARTFFIFLFAWAAIIAFFTLQLHWQLPQERSLTKTLTQTVHQWAPWILLSPLIFWLTARYPLTPPDRIIKHGMIHVVLSILIALLAQASLDGTRMNLKHEGNKASPDRGPRPPHHPPLGGPPNHVGPPPDNPGHPPRERRPPRPSPFENAIQHLPRTLPTYWTIVGIQSVLLFGQQLRRREKEALELKAKLTQSQLDTLRLQLQPHFFFNALNAISTLVYRDPKVADQMIGNLSFFWRGVLDEKDANQLTLERELELLDAYMSVEQMRFGERVQFNKSIDPACFMALVPTLLLQPIVENAVRHGLEPKGSKGSIWLSAQRAEGRLAIRVEDDGIGRQSGNQQGWGIGLSNARARLTALYGDQESSLTLNDREGGGTIVAMDLPFEKQTS